MGSDGCGCEKQKSFLTLSAGQMHLTLKHFILQAQVFSLYRFAIRASRHIPDPSSRKETVKWFREEIERNRYVEDVDQIKNLIATGRRELKQVLPLR
ncbi:hypothetical protein PNOK_0192900 [Pyrrhoderma noxium]|uniref:LYR motif-containing protein 2 n=1 Tax=Pyrrhoderma noxium TaxID=2282107 RepID=A0A286UQX7_9AGAM|nr:hypothetical protein PNOK_0192900 [Pyrrhoderma noxium]